MSASRNQACRTSLRLDPFSHANNSADTSTDPPLWMHPLPQGLRGIVSPRCGLGRSFDGDSYKIRSVPVCCGGGRPDDIVGASLPGSSGPSPIKEEVPSNYILARCQLQSCKADQTTRRCVTPCANSDSGVPDDSVCGRYLGDHTGPHF